jgi:hypothetical protein
VVVLGRDNDETVGRVHRRSKPFVLDRFSGIVDGQTELRDVDQYAVHAGTSIQELDEHPRDVSAQAALASSAEDDGNRECARHHVVVDERVRRQVSPGIVERLSGPVVVEERQYRRSQLCLLRIACDRGGAVVQLGAVVAELGMIAAGDLYPTR